MNTLNIFLKEFKQNVRNGKANVMMILFPIVLMLILGTAFSGIFNRTVTLENISVLYTNRGSRELAAAFESFLDRGKEMGIAFRKTDNTKEGMNSIKDVKYSCYILISGSPDRIKLYKNERYSFEANFVQTLVESFVQRYNVIYEIAVTNPVSLDRVLKDTRTEFVRDVSLDRKRQPSSLDHFAVTMLTLILMYSSLTGMWSVKGEQILKTGNRMMCSPVRRYEILVGKILGCIFITLLQAIIVILVSKYILKTYWGTDIGLIMILLLAESIMAISIGTGIAFLIKSEAAASGVLNAIIPVIVLFGGGYAPLQSFGKSMLKLTDYSPLKWVNQAIFRIIYNNDASLVPTALLFSLAVAVVFITVSSLMYRKEAV